MSPRPPCSLSALGMINSLGSGAREIAPRLFEADPGGLAPVEGFVRDRALWLGAAASELPPVPEALARFACRNNALSLVALSQIRDAVDDALVGHGRARLGVVIGTSTSGVGDAEAAIAHHARTSRLSPTFHYDQLEFGGAGSFVANLLGAEGPAYTLSTACSSGARALASARSLIHLGLCDAVVAGATDSLCGLTTHGFGALQALSDERTNPMSRNRRGLNLGEGSALFLVTGDPGGIQLLGVGESSEAHHMSAPDPEGRGARLAMEGALRDAGVDAPDVAYLNLHGTGTPLNDQMEGRAVAGIFGAELPCSSTKPLVGHTLGAAGAMEAGFCWLALEAADTSGLPALPHLYDGEPDPEIPTLSLCTEPGRIPLGERGLVMTNSFGFGGNNCTLLLGRAS